MPPLWQFVLLYIAGVFVLFYFLTILPGKRKNKQQRQMHDSLAVGDEVSTAGGIIGTIVERDGDVVRIRIDDETNVTMRVIVYAIQSVITKAPQ